MKKLFKLALICIASTAVVAGCATVPGPGSKEGAVPPRIVDKDGAKLWNDPSAFGPVPANLAAAGQRVCSSMDTKDMHFQALGYHSKAQGVDGKPFVGGGYYCAQK